MPVARGSIAADQRPFRVGDPVTVHNYIRSDTGPVRGRVICVNRKTRYNQPVVVLIDMGDQEEIEVFCPDGTRYLQGSETHLTLGWKS